MWLLNLSAFFRLVDCFALFYESDADFLLIPQSECSKRQSLIWATCTICLHPSVCTFVNKTATILTLFYAHGVYVFVHP